MLSTVARWLIDVFLLYLLWRTVPWWAAGIATGFVVALELWVTLFWLRLDGRPW
jgi:O-antigen/teichoic acid export membrane protein